MRVTVTEDHVGDVVAMMTGIPVQRIAEKESGKLARMDKDIEGKVIGQEDAINKVVKAIKGIALVLKTLTSQLVHSYS